MIRDFLTPINKDDFNNINFDNPFLLASKVSFYEGDLSVVKNGSIVFLGVEEIRGSLQEDYYEMNIIPVRNEFYKLSKGNWGYNIIDLGNITAGNSLSDTYFALTKVISHLIEKDCFVIILGGGHDLTYSMYRAFDTALETINLCSIDRKFDLGLFTEEHDADSYLNRVLTEEPRKLFNYYNLGHQSYNVAQEEMDLIIKMNFEYQRLGHLSNGLIDSEPFIRETDIMSIDMSAIRFSESPANSFSGPNGLDGKEICALTRYAGLSPRVKLLGIFEFNNNLDIRNQSAKLVAQMLWYFIEGVNLRDESIELSKTEENLYYTVPVDDREFKFVKNKKSDLWWMELEYDSLEKKSQKKIIIPCSYKDYKLAVDGGIPDRWWKNYKKYL